MGWLSSWKHSIVRFWIEWILAMAGHRLKDEAGRDGGIVLTQLPTYSFDVELCSMVYPSPLVSRITSCLVYLLFILPRSPSPHSILNCTPLSIRWWGGALKCVSGRRWNESDLHLPSWPVTVIKRGNMDGRIELRQAWSSSALGRYKNI